MTKVEPYRTPGHAANLLAETTVAALILAIYLIGRPWTGLVEFWDRGFWHQIALILAAITILGIVHPPLLRAWDRLVRRRRTALPASRP